MVPRLPALAALFLLALSPRIWAEGPAPTAGAAASPLPLAAAFTEKDLADKTVSLAMYRGEVVMLNFWGTWCPPCRAEVPALERLHDKYQGKLEIVGAAVFSSEADVGRFYEDYQINYRVFMGSYDLMDKYGQVSAIPTTFLINKRGEIAAKVVGSRSQAQYEELLGPLLAE